MTSSVLAFGSGQMPMKIAFLPSERTTVSELAEPSSTLAMSPMRMTASPLPRTTSCSNSSTVEMSVLAERFTATSAPLV